MVLARDLGDHTSHFGQGTLAIIAQGPSQQICQKEYQTVHISSHPWIVSITKLAKPRTVLDSFIAILVNACTGLHKSLNLAKSLFFMTLEDHRSLANDIINPKSPAPWEWLVMYKTRLNTRKTLQKPLLVFLQNKESKTRNQENYSTWKIVMREIKLKMKNMCFSLSLKSHLIRFSIESNCYVFYVK